MSGNGTGVEFLHKPYPARDLLEMVSTSLSRAEAANEAADSDDSQDRLVSPVKHSVLVVDDEPGLRRSVCELINVLGLSTLEAESGEAALEICSSRAGEIALVILDLQMPGMSGEETLLRLTELQPHLPVVLCHGGGDDALSLASRELLSGVLRKPFQVTDLQALLTTLLPSTRVES